MPRLKKGFRALLILIVTKSLANYSSLYHCLSSHLTDFFGFQDLIDNCNLYGSVSVSELLPKFHFDICVNGGWLIDKYMQAKLLKK